MPDKFLVYLRRLFPIAVAMSLAMSTAAKADAIDGNWCSQDGKSLHIDGPVIITPGGTKMSGTYDRHHFSYVSPKREDHAGKTLSMSQSSEQRMDMTMPDGSLKPWSRCEIVS